MLKYFTKRRGVISLFLTLILAPVMVFSGVVIDGSRYYAAKSIISSAGDLTLNTGLSNFDTKLKDVYGLFAMHDTPQEMENALQGYIKDMIEKDAGFETKGATAGAITNLLSYITGDYDASTFNNSIKLALEDGTFDAYNIPSSNLGNSNVFENQVVEYMKYRGPATLIMSIAGIFGKLGKFEEASKQTEVIEKEQAFQEEYAELGEEILMAYLFTREYLDYYEKTVCSTSTNLSTVIEGELKKMQQAFKVVADLDSVYHWEKLTDENLRSVKTPVDKFINDKGIATGDNKYKAVKDYVIQNFNTLNGGTYSEIISDIYANQIADHMLDEFYEDDLLAYMEAIQNELKAKGFFGYNLSNMEKLSGDIDSYATITYLDAWLEYMRNQTSTGQADAFQQMYANYVYSQYLSQIKYQEAVNTIFEFKFSGKLSNVSKSINCLLMLPYKEKLEDRAGAIVEITNDYNKFVEYTQNKRDEYVSCLELAYAYEDAYAFYAGIQQEKANRSMFTFPTPRANGHKYYSYLLGTALHLGYEESRRQLFSMSYDKYGEPSVYKNTFILDWIDEACEKVYEVIPTYARLLNAQNDLESAIDWLNVIIKHCDDLDTLRTNWQNSNNKLEDSSYKDTTNQKIKQSEKVKKEQVQPLVDLLTGLLERVKKFRALYETVEVRSGYKIDYKKKAVIASEIEDLIKSVRVSTISQFSAVSVKDYVQDTAVPASKIAPKPKISSSRIFRVFYYLDSFIHEAATQRLDTGADSVRNFIESIDSTGIEKSVLLNQHPVDPNSHMITLTYGDIPTDVKITLEDLNKVKDDAFYKLLKGWTETYENNSNNPDKEKDKQENSDAVDDVAGKAKVEKEEETPRTEQEQQEADNENKSLSDIINLIKEKSGYKDSSEAQKLASAERVDNDGIGDKDNAKSTSKKMRGTMEKIKQFFKDIGNLAKTIIKNERDIIYVVAYAMNDFTCQTTNKDPDNNKDFSDAKNCDIMLSGYTLDPVNNYFYRQEIEYIIFGGDSPSDAVGTCKGSIFLIRFGLNAIYAFTSADIQGITNPAATAVTCCFPFLQPLVNAVITLILAAAEAGIDVKDLLDGKDVVIYKTADTWTLSLSGAIKRAVDEATKVAVKAVQDGINAAYAKLEKGIEDGADNLEQLATDYVNELAGSIKSKIQEDIYDPITSAILSAVEPLSFGEETIEEAKKKYKEMAEEQINKIAAKIKDSTASMDVGGFLGEAEDEALKNFKSEILEKKIYPEIDSILSKTGEYSPDKMVKEISNKLSEKTQEYVDEVATKVNSKIGDLKKKAVSYVLENTEKIKDQLMNQATGLIEDTMDSIAGNLTSNLSSTASSATKGTSNTFMPTLSYKDYLVIFMMLGMQGESHRHNMETRMLALMQVNLSQTKKGASAPKGAKALPKDPKFDISDCYTMIGIRAKFRVGMMFLGNSNKDLTLSEMGNGKGVTIDYLSFMGY